MSRTKRAGCPTPTKWAHRTEAAATRYALRAADRFGATPRVYLCSCGRWHLTRWTLDAYQKKTEARQAYDEEKNRDRTD